MNPPHAEAPEPDEVDRTVEVHAGARLHFGLLDTVAPFGGAGMMIDRPVTHIAITAADTFEVVGAGESAGEDFYPLSQLPHLRPRITAVAQRFAQSLSMPVLPAVRIAVLRRPPPHSGLGTGTQLAMAVAAGLSRWFRLDSCAADRIQQAAARGARSGVGSYGFFSGGLVVDREQAYSLPLPQAWRVVLLRPSESPQAVSGSEEVQRFARLQRARVEERQELERLLCEQLEPAARVADFPAFAQAVCRYNWLSGKLFEASQGGPYNGPSVAALVDAVQQRGYPGVGQSSWGPTVFALCQDAASAQRLADSPPSEAATAVVAAPLNAGARVEASL